MSAMDRAMCGLCKRQQRGAPESDPPDHLHCDGVVLLPERYARSGAIASYCGAWSRGQDLSIVVSRVPRSRVLWSARLRKHGAWVDLVVADGESPEQAASELEISINELRGAFGRRRRYL